MSIGRRRFLAASAGLAASLAARAAPAVQSGVRELLPASRGRRVVIVGGGWGGLTAARHLRDLAPDLDVVVLERNPVFWSGPLSNKWLADLVDTRHLRHDYRQAAGVYGYTFVQAEVSAVDRDARRVVTADGSLAYDWLILAAGIRYDYSPWFGDDTRAIDHTRRHFPGAYVAGEEFPALKRKLAAFKGGDLIMALPPAPYRCPPSPYERACIIGWLLKSRRIPGKLIVLDPNPIVAGFTRTFREQFKDQIVYVPEARVKSIDPFARKISTEFDDFRFDDAILIPPQQAADPVWQAGLIGKDSQGKPTGWADQDPLHLHARDDERIFLIGDLMGRVSDLFGYYPKSAHVANRQGRIVAREIAARARGIEPETLLPDGACYVLTSIEPMEAVRFDNQYRLRGDGLIVQTTRQSYDPNPRGEDVQWADEMFAEFLAFKP